MRLVLVFLFLSSCGYDFSPCATEKSLAELAPDERAAQIRVAEYHACLVKDALAKNAGLPRSHY